MDTFTGTGVALITPFDDDLQPDLPALRRLVQYVTQGGVDYLVALGTTAETPTLSPSEQEQVLKTIWEENQGKLPIVIGVGGNNTADVCKKVQHITHTYQPQGILSVCPYYNRPTQAGLYAHFQAIASHTHIPLMLYNVPGRTGSALAPKTAIRLAHHFPHINAIKEATGTVMPAMQLLAEAPPHLQILSGDDALTLPMMSLGGKGLVSVIANVFPQQVSRMVRAALHNDWDTARTAHYQLLPLMDLCFQEGNPTGIKAMAAQQGLCQNGLRLPLQPASEGLQEAIQQAMSSFPLSESP